MGVGQICRRNTSGEWISRSKSADFCTRMKWSSSLNSVLPHPPPLLSCLIATVSCPSSTALCAPVFSLTQEGWLAFSPLWELGRQNRLLAAGRIPVGHFTRQWCQEWPWSTTELSLNNLIDERIVLFTLRAHLFSPSIWHRVINTHTVKGRYF